jgi:hypothetical protein
METQQIIIAGHGSVVAPLDKLARALRHAHQPTAVFFNGDVAALAECPRPAAFVLLGLSDASFNNSHCGFYAERHVLHAARMDGIPIGLYYGNRLTEPAPCFADLSVYLHAFVTDMCEPSPVNGELLGPNGILKVRKGDAPFDRIASAIIARAAHSRC